MDKKLKSKEIEVINELRKNYTISYKDFSDIWSKYDLLNNGNVSVGNVESCVRDMISMVNVPTLSPYKEAVCAALAKEKLCHVHKMSALLPVSGEMFIRFFQHTHDAETPSVAFMALWKKCDVDQNGYLDKAETTNLVKYLLDTKLQSAEKSFGVAHKKFQIDEDVLLDFVKRLFVKGDEDKDGKIQLKELAALLNVEKNFLDICPKNLQQKELNDIFGHYDKDSSGCVEGPEFLAFVRDVLNIDKSPLSRSTRKSSDVDVDELQLAGDMIMGLVDDNDDGKLDRSELGAVMAQPRPRLICKSREFMEMQSSFDSG